MRDEREGKPEKTARGVIRKTGNKALRKVKRLGRTARRWIKARVQRSVLARAEPRPVALLQHARVSGRRLSEIQARMTEEIQQNGLSLACAAIHSSISLCQDFGVPQRVQRSLYIGGMRAIAQVDRQRAAAFGEQYLAELYDPRAAHTLVTIHKVVGNYDRALALLEDLPRDEWYYATLAVLRSRSLEQRFLREFGDELRAAQLAGDDRVLEVADRLFTTAGEADKMLAYRVLRTVLGKAFRANRGLSALLLRYAHELTALGQKDAYIAMAACDAHLHFGSMSKAAEALEQLAGDDPRTAHKLAKVRSLKRLLDDGFTYTPALVEQAYSPLPSRVLCVLHNSLPFNSGGYATRSHGVLSGLARRGWGVSGVTRLGYPDALSKEQDEPLPPSRVGDVSYFRLRNKAVPYGAVAHDYLAAFTNALLELVQRERPEVLHACSNHLNGLAANIVARALGIKTVYEVRGLWEVTRISRQPDWNDTEYFNLMSRMEVQAAVEADAVICITRALRDEMVRRGVPAEKITIVPNGVDVERFVPKERNQELADRLGLGGKKVIGYIGSVVDYEGLDLLLHAVVRLRDRGVTGFAVLIVGDGAVLDDLKRLAHSLGIADLVLFTGRVPHEEVEDYYSIVDVVPLPRKSLPVTEMVSPLKPFEAMAMNKIIVAANVAALAEIIVDGVNGILFQKDDVADLAEKLETVLHPAYAAGLQPREWVVANRSWQHLSGIVDDIYKRLTSRLEPALEVPLNQVEIAPDFEEVRSTYRERYNENGQSFLRRADYARWSYVAERIVPGASLLDVGVGVGQFINTLAARGGFQRLVGVDIHQHSKFLRLHEGYTMDYVSIADLPYRDGEFDVVTCMETIEHLPESIFLKGVNQLRRVCRQQLIITVPFREETLSKGHVRRFDFGDLERLFPRGQVTLFRRELKGQGRPAFWALIEERVGESCASTSTSSSS